jgi:1,4-alpha-glucan branching enzyme
MARPDYRVGVPRGKQYKLLIDSDAAKYGGTGTERPSVYKAVKQECDGKPYSFGYDLPPYGVAIFEF